jgi:hypothetical protein
MVVVEEPLYAAFFLPSSVLLGWALWGWEGRCARAPAPWRFEVKATKAVVG